MEPLHPDDVTEKEALLIMKGLLSDMYEGWSLKSVLLALYTGHKKLWRLTGNGANAIYITQLELHPSGKEVFIWMTAGTGVARNRDDIYDVVDSYRRSVGAKFIGFMASTRASARMFGDYYGADLVGYRYMKEID